MISHAILRSLQILRSPSALHDRHELSAALGGPPGQGESLLLRLLPAGLRATLYRIALERGFEDALVGRFVVAPVLATLEAAAEFERRLVARLGGSQDVADEWHRDRGAE